ncbi:MAG: thpR [Burkholderiaceae bacterium]|nr:thpR [Burkholderiaceae bacterium]
MTQPRPNLFYALWPDEATRAELTVLQAHVRGRLIRPPNLHLTLAFLGPQPEECLPTLKSLLSGIHCPPVRLEIDRMGHFGKNHIAWAGTHALPPELSTLRQALTTTLAQASIPFDHKAFKPHITLARDAAPPPDLPFDPFYWLADRIVLARSPLAGEKPFYRVLASQTLAANPACPADID